ncbi:hypothetical protein BH24CHL2_BH24CHL2_6540 [soil metagenome]
MSRHPSHAFAPVLVAVVFSASVAMRATAQEAACTLDPIALPLFDATPAAAIAATPHASTDVPELDEQGAAVAVSMLLACAGEEPQALRYAIYTDGYLARLFIGDTPADQPAFERMIATGANIDAVAPTLEGIAGLEAREDGRVAVTIEATTVDGPIEDRLVLAWDARQEAWLIDEIVSLDPPPSSPTP